MTTFSAKCPTCGEPFKGESVLAVIKQMYEHEERGECLCGICQQPMSEHDGGDGDCPRRINEDGGQER